MVRLRAIHSRCDSQPVGQVTEWVRRDAARGFWSHGCRRPSDGLTCLAGSLTGSTTKGFLRVACGFTRSEQEDRLNENSVESGLVLHASFSFPCHN